MYAEVIIGISIDKLDRAFTYRIPEELGEPFELIGSEVIVPFGRGNKETKAFIVDIKEEAGIDESLVKHILKKSERSVKLEKGLIEFAYWLKKNYGGTINEALHSVLQVPKKIERLKKRRVSLLIDRESAEKKLEEFKAKKYAAKARVIEKCLAGDFDAEELIRDKKASSATFDSLCKGGIIEIKEELLYRQPVRLSEISDVKIELNEGQKKAAGKIIEDYNRGIMGKYLLFGITGSGKTEVYMEIMEEVINSGRQVIFLIPEIALSFQAVDRLSRRFGSRISIINSKMSAGERYDQYLRAKNGEIDIIVGPRSALFTPFTRLGLIIVDEEHETSYKSSKTPRYHAREASMYRADKENAAIILGSATPSLEAVKLAMDKKLEVLMLKERPEGVLLPEIEIADLREELKRGNRSMISKRLAELIDDRLRKKEQIMLFINRRGYASFVSCRSCGEALKCPHCDISLSFHKKQGRLICHYCGYAEKMPDICPKCGSPYIGAFGVGTEKVEEIVKRGFPSAKVLRMDADTTSGKSGHEGILEKFKNEEADILIGTQMIVKGHDFANVTLVGILAADLSLFMGNFRASEITYELIVQAAGRAGRGKRRGKAVIQTYNPEHYVIKAAQTGKYKDFYAKEIKYRKLAQYPPEKHLLAVIILSAKKEEADRAGEKICAFLSLEKSYHISGPLWPDMPKLKDIYRKVIYLKSEDREKLVRAKDRLEKYAKEDKELVKIGLQFDFEPYANP